MSNDSSRFQEISCHTFNAVGRDQIIYNNYSTARSGHGQAEFPPGEEWKVELYKEFRRVPIGECYFLETIYESRVQPPWACDDIRRVFRIARLGDGQSNPPKLSIAYKGRHAKEAFREDCMLLSRIKDVNVAQLYGFNDSENCGPMIFFHDELIPAQYVLQKHPSCQTLLLQYFSFHVSSVPESSIPFFGRYIDWSNVWVRPQNGLVVLGPRSPWHVNRSFERIFRYELKRFFRSLLRGSRNAHDAWNVGDPGNARNASIEGPSIEVNVRTPEQGVDWSSSLAHQQFIFAIPPHQYDIQSLLRYLANLILHGFYHPNFVGSLQRVKPPPQADTHFTVLFTSATRPPCVIARFPFSAGVPNLGNYDRGEWTWCEPSYDGEHSQVLMEDGRIRIQCKRYWTQEKYFFRFSRPDSHKLSSIWVAHALHIFSALGIPWTRWSGYGYLSELHFQLETKRYTNFTCFGEEGDDSPCYLFTDPLRWPILHDPLHIASGTDSTFYYWSPDPHGRTVMTESECVTQRLPSLDPKVRAYLRTWGSDTYNFMRELQEARGFDPTTTDFARAMKYPILEVVHDYEDLHSSDSSPSFPSLVSVSETTSEYESDEDRMDTNSPPCSDSGDCSLPVHDTTESMDMDIIMEDLTLQV